jgi:protein-tyrosine-phosphatase
MTAPGKRYNVLFLCTGNSARSILGEVILNNAGDPRFRAYSAGSQPAGQVNPYALELLASLGSQTGDLRSKSWDEFAAPDAPAMDFVFTVCDSAASESCPVWPGHPMTAHWGIPDPAAVDGSEAEKRLAFADAHRMLSNRIKLFMALPIASLDKLSLQRKLVAIGEESSHPAGIARRS